MDTFLLLPQSEIILPVKIRCHFSINNRNILTGTSKVMDSLIVQQKIRKSAADRAVLRHQSPSFILLCDLVQFQ